MQPDLQFQKTWRPYQERVLTALEQHLHNRKLHVVAAPGAGKTTLGIEVCRRLQQPALILSPTRSIRDQWIDRLRDFLPAGTPFPPPWVSAHLRQPGAFTSVTYQALHAWYREDLPAEAADPSEAADEEEPSDPEALRREEIQLLAEQIRSHGIRTLVLDEAHHLRQEWWTALSSVLEAVPGIITVSLTATPPYDVSGSEWRNYVALCGPIDAEISVPELVKAGTLCPHQDLLWTVPPHEDTRQMLLRHEHQVETLTAQLSQDQDWLEAVEAHPWIAAPPPDPAEMLDQVELTVGLLVFLRHRGRPLPKALLRALSLSPEELPDLSTRWWQVLLQAFLFDKRWQSVTADLPLRTRLTKELRAQELLSRRELRIDGLKSKQRSFALCPSKVDAVCEIHHLEQQTRGNQLRQVILVDFIRDEGLAAGVLPLPQLGAWPLFADLAGRLLPESQRRCALLTGRVMVLHEDRLPDLLALLPQGLPAPRPLPMLPGFVQVGRSGAPLTPAFTQLLIQGDLHVLVGTRALLGEGWDAPVINSLILCTAVGSFMLTNQMRGRAIRVDPRQPEKCASIWHLATLAPFQASGCGELFELQRKFGTFVGLDEKKPEITSGIRRLRLPFVDDEKIYPHLVIHDLNEDRMRRRLQDFSNLRGRWQTAIEQSDAERIAPGVSAAPPPRFQGFVFTQTLRRLVLQFLSAWGALAMRYAGHLPQNEPFLPLLILMALLFAAAFLRLLPRTLHLLWLCWRTLPVDGSLRQMALALRDALCEADLLPGNPKRFPVRCVATPDGTFFLHLQQAEFHEQSLYADALGELLGPLENPRNLITRNGRNLLGLQRQDLHAVPAILAQNKDKALCFLRAWQKRLGPSELCYTRTPEGRQHLLRIRANTFATAQQPRARRNDRWV